MLPPEISHCSPLAYTLAKAAAQSAPFCSNTLRLKRGTKRAPTDLAASTVRVQLVSWLWAAQSPVQPANSELLMGWAVSVTCSPLLTVASQAWASGEQLMGPPEISPGPSTAACSMAVAGTNE